MLGSCIPTGSPCIDRTTQAARMPPAHHLPPQPPEVRPHVRRDQEDHDAAPHQGRRQSPH